jgi:hypothetical protein
MFEYVKINGKKMPVKYGFNALRHFSRMTGISINQMESLSNNMTFDTALTLIFCGLMDGARAAKEKFSYTIDDLADDLDTDMTAIDRCMTLFADQMGGKETEEKKSQPKKQPKKAGKSK